VRHFANKQTQSATPSLLSAARQENNNKKKRKKSRNKPTKTNTQKKTIKKIALHHLAVPKWVAACMTEAI
jgi:hypothetical protein